MSAGYICEALATGINRTLILFTFDKCPKAIPFVSALVWSTLVRIGREVFEKVLPTRQNRYALDWLLPKPRPRECTDNALSRV